LREVLTEGYCQYGTAFVEDDWEVAKFGGKPEEAEYHSARASKMFTRCMNYALVDLPAGLQKDLFGPTDGAAKAIAAIGGGQRTALMWAGIGLGGMINHNLGRSELLSAVTTVTQMLERVVALDKAQYGELDGTKRQVCDAPCTTRLALPHIALGMILSAASSTGDAKRAVAEFKAALQITASADHPDGRMLLARVLMAYRVGRLTNDRKLFHDELVKVLETDPAIWPEQRLANEVAHRRARRYLSHEKDWFQ
jgi:hypothetical protein